MRSALTAVTSPGRAAPNRGTCRDSRAASRSCAPTREPAREGCVGACRICSPGARAVGVRAGLRVAAEGDERAVDHAGDIVQQRGGLALQDASVDDLADAPDDELGGQRRYLDAGGGV